MTARQDPCAVFEWLVIGLIILFGGWHLLSTFSVISGASFATLTAAGIAFAILAFCLVPLFVLGDSRYPKEPWSMGPGIQSNALLIHWKWLLAAAFSIVVLYWLYRVYWIFWLLGIVVLIIRMAANQLSDSHKTSEWSFRWTFATVLLLSFLVAMVGLSFQSSDSDVAFQLSIPVSSIDNPDLPLLSFDGMHRDFSMPILSPIYFVESYLLLVGVVAKLTGISVTTVYYLIFPPLFGAFLVLAHWLLLRELFGNAGVIGLVVVVVVLLSWGGFNTYGSYTFQFMFEAKSTIITIWTPLLILCSIRFLDSPSIVRWCLLFLCQAATICASSSGLVLAPLIVGLVFLSTFRFDKRSILVSFIGMTSTLYPLLLGLWVTFLPDVSQQVLQEPYEGGTAGGLRVLFGNGARFYLGLFGVLAAAIIPGEYREWRIRFGLVLAMFALVFNPWVPQLLASHVAWPLSWRVFWTVPAPLLIGCAVTAAVRASWQTNPNFRSGSFVPYFFLLAFLVGGNWAVRIQDLGRPALKVGPGYPIAEKLVAKTKPTDLVLAPGRVAIHLPSFHNSPRLLVVLRHYIGWQQVNMNQKESHERLMLSDLVNGRDVSPEDLDRATQLILQKNVNIVLLNNDVPRVNHLEAELQKSGFKPVKIDTYTMWKRDELL